MYTRKGLPGACLLLAFALAVPVDAVAQTGFGTGLPSPGSTGFPTLGSAGLPTPGPWDRMPSGNLNSLVSRGALQLSMPKSYADRSRAEDQNLSVMIWHSLTAKAFPDYVDENAWPEYQTAYRAYFSDDYDQGTRFPRKPKGFNHHVTPSREPVYRVELTMSGSVTNPAPEFANKRHPIWSPLIERFVSRDGGKLGSVVKIGVECKPALYERACSAGFRTLGTGFLVDPNQHRHAAGPDDSAYVLTALHIFFDSDDRRIPDHLQRIVIQFEHSNGEPAYRSVPTGIYVRQYDDVALLRIPSANRERLLLSAPPLRDAPKSITVGYTADRELKRRHPDIWIDDTDEVYRTLSPGILRVVSLQGARFSELRRDARSTILNTASLGRGNSGSPVFDLETATVIGMHNCGFTETMNVAIDAVYIENFLSDFSPSRVVGSLPSSGSGHVCSRAYSAATKQIVRRHGSDHRLNRKGG